MELGTSPPIKPPRGIKPGKETSGLLISVIRALSASETNEQREVEKAKLEKDFKKCDQKLDELVSIHEQDLTEVMRIFGILSERVTAAREKIHSVKENLNACKQLLNCRREELMKLWLEGVEHKHVLQLLNDIDQLKEIPMKLNTYLERKHYLHATQLLVSALSMGDGILEEVEALREVRIDLENKKQKLSSKLMEELNKHLYKEYPREVGLRRQGSNRDFQRGIEIRGSKGNKIKRNLLDVTVPGFLSGQISRKTSSVGLEDMNNIVEDEDNMNPEENPEHFLAVIIECLALLNQIPEAIEVVKSQMQNELLKIVEQVSKSIEESTDKKPSANVKVHAPNIYFNSSISQSFLVEFLYTIFERFQQVISSHSSAASKFANAIKKYNVEISLYEMTDVWSNIQAVLQILLTEYLDVQSLADDHLQSSVSLNEQTNDINYYFARRKPQRQKNGLLFKFESSTHNYLKDHRYSSLVSDGKDPRGKKYLVCKPDPKNVTVVFKPIMLFIDEIERALGIASSSNCPLSNFLADYVKEVYLGRHHVLVATTIDTATKSPDAWRATTSPELTKELGLSRPLLQSTVKVQQCVSELRLLMIALPLQGEHFCTLALNVLHNYRETCQNAYRSIVQPDRHDRLICSAAWLKDEDISRFIKSLPNWENMKVEVTHRHRKGPGGRMPPRRQETQDEESPEDIRQRNVREAEILASNLGEGGIAANEILADPEKLRSLALIQESLEWFSSSVRALIRELRHSNPERQATAVGEGDSLPPMPDSVVQLLEQVAGEYDELANTCILVLHLEARVQCFYYLHPRANEPTSRPLCSVAEPEEPDPRVEELSRVLQHMDEALQSTLHPKKTKYIFEGLGHLIAKILITSAQYIEKIDESGIQRMCRNVFTLQQTLTNITMTRELALDYARQYYEMLNETPEDILNGILEHGSRFSELEYINALQLIARTRQEYSLVNKHLERLSEILGDVGVTV